jgi:type VI secretion system protein ImpJ
MSDLQRVLWSEGLLMAPQHLQQLDRYHEALLSARIDGLERYGWGALAVEIDTRALSAGQVQLNRFHGVMPDGVVLRLDQGDTVLPPSRPIDNHFPPTSAALEVFLSLPRERPGTNNFAQGTQTPVRFRSAARKVYDVAAVGQELELSFSAPNLSLRFGDEARDDFVSIKVAEIVRDDAGGLVVCDPYIPPCLRVSASPFVMARLRALLAAMVTRQRSLSEARRQGSDASIEFNNADVTRFLLLSTVNGFIPVMAHLSEGGDVSPLQTYLLLCQMAGQLSTFDANADPTQLPRFAFTDLRSTFEELFGRITALLHASVAEHFVAIPLTASDDGMHKGALEDERIGQCDRFFISVKTDLPEAATAARLPQLSKIASFRDIHNILTAATPGAPVEVAHRPPPEIPIKAGHVYFSVSTDNAYWRNIRGEKRVVVYLPPFFEPTRTKVELMGVPRRAAAAQKP